MALRINTNIASLNAHRQLSETNNRLRVIVGRLSTGNLINRSKDDVLRLAFANKFRMEVRALRSVRQNVGQARPVLLAAKWGAQKIKKIIARLKELAVFTGSSCH